MEKILIALDGGSPGKDTLSFGIYLSRLTHSAITGIFLENQPEAERPVVKNLYDGTYLGWEVDENSPEWQAKMEKITRNIDQFRTYYNNHDIVTRVHRDEGMPVKELVTETRYADLLLLDPETSFRDEFEKLPTSFVEEMLTQAECPVIIAPASFLGIEEIVFTWDGSQSAVFAIKQFTYLFPQLKDKKAIIVQAGEAAERNYADKEKLQEWLEAHYVQINWEQLTGEVGTALFGYLLNKKKVFIVLGAYGRSQVSRFFRHSHAEKILKTITQPIFITHSRI
ncbi:MAG: universal stress protein [Niastella sp.]|nr:universal stress protein [Niastella sp.]